MTTTNGGSEMKTNFTTRTTDEVIEKLRETSETMEKIWDQIKSAKAQGMGKATLTVLRENLAIHATKKDTLLWMLIG